MDSHNIFVFHLKFGGLEETHFETRIGQDRRERETMFGKHDQHSSNLILLIPTISSFSIWNLAVSKNTCWTKKSARQHTNTRRDRGRERNNVLECMMNILPTPFFLIPIVSSFCIWKFGGFKTHMSSSNLLCCCRQMRGWSMYRKVIQLRRVYKDLFWIWKKVHIKLHHVKHNPKFIDCGFLWFLWSNIVFMIQFLSTHEFASTSICMAQNLDFLPLGYH